MCRFSDLEYTHEGVYIRPEKRSYIGSIFGMYIRGRLLLRWLCIQSGAVFSFYSSGGAFWFYFAQEKKRCVCLGGRGSTQLALAECVVVVVGWG